MKNKTLKKLLCFLLAFVVMVSTPMNMQASALAIEPWVIWAIVTYMTSVGLVFTATGGAQAVYDAVEEKVNEYGNNVIDFYDIVRNNIRIVPPSNQPPNWNPELGNFFLNAIAVEALSEFIAWLTSDGGWLNGTNVNADYSFSTFDATIDNGQNIVEDITCVTSLIDDWETANKYKRALVKLEGTSFSLPYPQIFKTSTSADTYTTITYVQGNTQAYYVANTLNGSFQNRVSASPALFVHYFNLNITPQEFLNQSQVAFINDGDYINAGLIYKGFFYLMGRLTHCTSVDTTLSAEIEIPTEVPEIKPLPTLEGLILESEVLAAESLERLGDVVENLFTDTGTIPAPQPNIIPDPEVVPDPSPVPTPVPDPEIEDIGELGLPALGEAIFNKFPFSLPKDLKRISDILNAEPVTPKWEIDLYETLGDRIPFQGSTEFAIDLAEYEELGQISRWASVISFTIFLIIATKGLIRW